MRLCGTRPWLALGLLTVSQLGSGCASHTTIQQASWRVPPTYPDSRQRYEPGQPRHLHRHHQQYYHGSVQDNIWFLMMEIFIDILTSDTPAGN